MAIIGEKKGFKITLADGVSYQFSPINLNIMEEVEEHFDMKWADIFADGRAKYYKQLFLVLLRESYPDMTLERIGELIDLVSMTKASNEISKQLGIE